MIGGPVGEVSARIDAVAGAVVDGERTWPLRLDCRTGGAVVTVGDRELTVTPMQWRPKQRLARWAHLGAPFVAAQRALLAVESGTTLDDEEQAIVLAVAAFLDGDALPLEPTLLASVAAEACRSTGLAPAAFDDRDAAEVELIWLSAPTVARTPSPHAVAEPASGRSAMAIADPWADATSIVFTPTAAPAASADQSSVARPTVRASDPGAPIDARVDEPTAASDPTPPAAAQQSDRLVPPTGAAAWRADVARHRIVPAHHPGRSVAKVAPTGEIVGTVPRESTATVTTGTHSPPTAPLAVALPTGAVATGPRLVPAAAARAPSDLLAVDQPFVATAAVPIPIATAAAPIPIAPETVRDPAGEGVEALVAAVTDRVMEQLAEQIADAADGMGIEV